MVHPKQIETNKPLLLVCLVVIVIEFYLLFYIRKHPAEHGLLGYIAFNLPVYIWWLWSGIYILLALFKLPNLKLRIPNPANFLGFLGILLLFLVGKTLLVFLAPPEASESLEKMPLFSLWPEDLSIGAALLYTFRVAFIEESARMLLINHLGRLAFPVSTVLFIMGHATNFITMPLHMLLIFLFDFLIVVVLYFKTACRFGLLYAVALHMSYDLVNINVFTGHKINAWLGHTFGLILVLMSLMLIQRFGRPRLPTALQE